MYVCMYICMYVWGWKRQSLWVGGVGMCVFAGSGILFGVFCCVVLGVVELGREFVVVVLQMRS